MEVAVSDRVSPSHIGPLLPINGLLKSHSPQNCFQALPFHILKQAVVVLNISSPNAGFDIASRCTVVRRVIRVPLSVELISSIADGSGLELVLLIETPELWEKPATHNRRKIAISEWGINRVMVKGILKMKPPK